jgi:hypothetical protein
LIARTHEERANLGSICGAAGRIGGHDARLAATEADEIVAAGSTPADCLDDDV